MYTRLNVKRAAKVKFEEAENQAIDSGRFWPDSVLKRKSDGKQFIVDVTVSFKNRFDLCVELSSNQPAEVVPFIVWALGAWDMAIDDFLA